MRSQGREAGECESGKPERNAKAATMRWSAGSVIDVCDSGFAAGLISYNGECSDGAHEALISADLWATYQVRREAQRIVPTKARS